MHKQTYGNPLEMRERNKKNRIIHYIQNQILDQQHRNISLESSNGGQTTMHSNLHTAVEPQCRHTSDKIAHWQWWNENIRLPPTDSSPQTSQKNHIRYVGEEIKTKTTKKFKNLTHTESISPVKQTDS